MRHNLFKYNFLVWLLSLEVLVFAQDIHFSQLERSPINLNPAETGRFNAQHRLVANYRSQWASVTIPYKTFSATYDHRRANVKKWPGFLGLGLGFNSDVAGDGHFGTIQVKLSGSYLRTQLFDSLLNVSGGFQVSYNQNTVDFNRLYFDNQFNGSQYDPNLLSQENFQGDRFSYFDFSLGLTADYYLSDKLPLHWGIVFHHLNRPKLAFADAEQNRLEGKFNTYLMLDWTSSKYWSIQPNLFYFRQGTYDEFFMGLMFEKRLNHIDFRAINFGLSNRFGDAVIFRLGFDYRSFDIGFSYDLNYSSLRVASNTIGAIEISVIYLMYKREPYIDKFNKLCPVFL